MKKMFKFILVKRLKLKNIQTMKPKLIMLLLAVLFIMGSCKDEFEYTLPSATQKGANTIGCKVDGVVCIPHGASIFSPYTKRLCYNVQNGNLNCGIYFIASDNDLSSGIPRMQVGFEIDSAMSVGSFHNFFASFVISPGGGGGISYEYHYNYKDFPELTGVLEITKLDKINHIISGRFNFEGYYISYSGVYDFSKKTSVTDGRFDIKYNTNGSCVLEY